MRRLAVFLLPLAVSGMLFAGEQKFGVVNFQRCVQESKMGLKEQEAFEEMKKKMQTLISDVEGQLKEISEKFSDPDYLDGLSPEGEQELKSKYQQLREEYERYQGQFYQAMNQTNMQMMQKIGQFVTQASGKIREEKGYTFVMNREACFAVSDAYDETDSVIAEMDRVYEKMLKDSEKTK